MRLSTLLASLFPISPSFDCEISGLTQNSRLVEPGSLFLACQGKTSDGRLYIDEALKKGACAIVAETPDSTPQLEWYKERPLLKLPRLSSALALLSARYFDYPAKKMKMLGVTGTNGKTSCSHFVAQALQNLHQSCGVIGTLGNGFPQALKETAMTTPDTITLQKNLAELAREQAHYVAMEVSSHSLDQQRIAGLTFEVGIFTNLTQDHLDYHETMAAYGAAKKRFFTDYPMGRAVINADDAFGRALMAALPPEKVLSYSTQGPVEGMASVYVKEVQFALSGIQATVFTPWGEGILFAPLVGAFNLNNLLAVVATLGALGFSLSDILASLSQLKPVPGRMQIFGGGKNPWIVVDYAHTPDALEKALLALRRHCQGKLHCLIGCGGDRDKGKRPLMAAVAEQYADFVLLTSDNPRHEKPEAIIADMQGGLKAPERVVIQANRSQAIQDIIQCASTNDYVLIAGKGAENYQQIGDEKLPFSDALRIEEILAQA
jgi:UDP-N-acetylmuramoyl-L-alanyl-D-glutamate--2,6-diaminopimelate ligase